MRLAPAGAYTFAPKLAVSEDGQMIAGWYAGVHPEVCSCGEQPVRRSTSHRNRKAQPDASGTQVVVDPGALPGGFERPIVLSDDGSDVEGELQVAVSGEHVAYASWEEAHGGWRIVALHGRQPFPLVRLPYRAGLAAPQLDTLLSSRDGPVIAVWTRFGRHDDRSWEYAPLRGDGTLGSAARIARIARGDTEPSFAINDSGQLAAAWVRHGEPGGPAQTLLVRCDGKTACSRPDALSLGGVKPMVEEVAVALSDAGTVSVLVSGHDDGTPTRQRVGSHLRIHLTPETNYRLWATSGPIEGEPPAPSEISKNGAAPMATAIGEDGAASAFQLRNLPNLRLAVTLRDAGTASFAPPSTLAGSRAPQPAALAANLKGTALLAWQQHSGSGQHEHSSTDTATVEDLHDRDATSIGVNPTVRRVPGTNDAAGATPAIGLDSDGEAVVLWNRTCNATPTCGMYASTIPGRLP